MDNEQTPAAENVIPFPKKSLVKKVSKYVLVTGCISAGVLVALNYKAKGYLEERPTLDSDSPEFDLSTN
jgi:hypothetical protein